MTAAELHALTVEECHRLLGTEEVGRLGVVRGGYPLILPVNYAIHGGRVVVHSDAGAKFSAARQHRVSFEVDKIDAAQRTGWSVLVQGFAVEVTAAGDQRYKELAALPVEPWAPGDRSRILLITPVTITGRRITQRPS